MTSKYELRVKYVKDLLKLYIKDDDNEINYRVSRIMDEWDNNESIMLHTGYFTGIDKDGLIKYLEIDVKSHVDDKVNKEFYKGGQYVKIKRDGRDIII